MTEEEREIYILNGGGYQPIGDNRIKTIEDCKPPNNSTIQQDN